MSKPSKVHSSCIGIPKQGITASRVLRTSNFAIFLFNQGTNGSEV